MFPPKEQISKKKKKSVSSSLVFLFSKSFAYFFIVAVLIFVSECVYIVLLHVALIKQAFKVLKMYSTCKLLYK